MRELSQPSYGDDEILCFYRVIPTVALMIAIPDSSGYKLYALHSALLLGLS